MKKTLYGFGLGVDGQFGIRLSGVSDSGCLAAPQQLFGAPVDEFGVAVTAVACGERHTVLLGADGKLWSVGANESGQLGRSGADQGSFTIYPVEMGTRIIQIAAGQNHSAAVSDDGRLFVWGRNAEFQCARTGPASITKPSRVVEITEAVQVACGANSCLALQQSGTVYVWGSFLAESFAVPRVVSIFSRIPVVQISAGDDHFVAVTSAGFVYAWGRNEYGQCGTGDTTDHAKPKLVKQLNTMKTVSVSCGGNHTVALTKDGRLFSFGYNVFGQLGTGRKEEAQPDPQLVSELLGSHVTKVACGRVHTVAVVNGRVLSFGLNSNGQLGTGSLSNAVITPQVVRDLHKVTTIFAGYDQTFAVEAPEVDLMSAPSAPLETPKFLSMSRLRQLFTDKSDNKLDIIGELESVFSSAACFNGSFAYTDDRRFNCSPTNIAMNLDDCMYTFNLIANHGDADRLGEIIVNCLKMGVFEDGNIFGRCLPSENPEVCKFLMALPWFHEMVHPEKYYDDLFIPFVKLLNSLKRYAPELLRRWWSGLATRHFNKAVLVLMTGVEHQIDHPDEVDQFDVIITLRLLKYLYKLNQDYAKVPVDHFYLDSLMEKADVRSDYFRWATDGSAEFDENEVPMALGSFLSAPSQLQKPFHFVDYPFLFNAEAKAALLEAEAQFAMYQAAQRPSTTVIPYFGIAQFIRPNFHVEVRRANIVEDTIHVLENASPHDFAKPLRVQFHGEEGHDEGGVRKEFFLLLFQQLLQPQYGMFLEDSESHYVWFSGLDVADAVSFNFVGRLCALAVYNAVLVDFPFPSALYKLLLGHKLTVDDLIMLHPTEGRSLQALIDHEDNDVEDVFGLSFQISVDVLGEAVDVELKPGGKDIPVTNENRTEFVRLYIQRRLELGIGDVISQQLNAFRNGFRNVMHSKILDFFQPHELMELMVGNENYDWDVFKENTEYKGEYFAGHNAIKAFWDAFFELDLEQRKKFLLFLMGSARIPVAGMKALKMVVQPVPSHLYPVAHTCFNLLDLPNIADKTEMKKRLLACLEHTQGFTLV
uniref:HECT domain-containing protein n=1 Tax=Steinernema glaseri TaxID=37863 RepID=A0A1I8AKH5_9BILA